jgi:hypothetical protein
MKTFVILRRNGWPCASDLQKAAEVSGRVGTREMADQVKWIRSYVLDEGQGAVGTVCIYQGTDADAVREHARRAGLPADEVIDLLDTVVVNQDPVAAAA